MMHLQVSSATQLCTMYTSAHTYHYDTMKLIVNSCPLTKLDDGLSRLHSADNAAVQWLGWTRIQNRMTKMARRSISYGEWLDWSNT